MKIDLKPVIFAPDTEIPIDCRLDFREEEINGEHLFYKPVSVSGSVKNHAGIIEMFLDVSAPVKTACARCGKEVLFNKIIQIDTVLVKELENGDETENITVISGDEVEIDEIVRSELILNMDMAYLCSEDCKGLCPQCGHDLNDGPCSCKPPMDDRFAELLKLIK